MRSAWLVLVLACGSAAPAVERDRVVVAPALGLSDVSILLPLPRDPRTPVLATALGDGVNVVDQAQFDALFTTPGDIAPKTGAAIRRDDFHIVAVRFDLCERSKLGACPAGEPGRLRLVLQPLYTRGATTFAHDVALHAFYPIPEAELAAVVGELRALAGIQGAPARAPLGVSPAATASNPAYLARLRTLVLQYAASSRLVRVTAIGQIADSAAFAWMFRGFDRRGGALVPIAIPGIAAVQQATQLAGGDTVYNTPELADAPAGFALAANGALFAAASAEQRVAALEALAVLQNPLLHDTNDTQCVGCHVATYLTARRASSSGLAPAAIRGRFTSALDLTIHTIAATDPRVVRAFGWAGQFPAISQRVVNETAQVLTELEARFPSP